MKIFDTLILDVLIYIAEFNEDVWYKLTRINGEFKEYAMTEAGKRKFIELATHITRKNVFECRIFGKLHNIYDYPSFINQMGTQYWHNRGEWHRDEDLPAIIHTCGTKYWCFNGNFHRNGDLPAIIHANGSQSWYKNGKYHRDGDLPAVIHEDGSCEWYQNGKFIKKNELI